MIKKYSILNNEDGSVIILALLMLAILTILGVSSTNTSTTELKIVRNEQLYQIHFDQAESGADEAMERIEQEKNTDQLFPSMTGYDWINDQTVNLSVPANWKDMGSGSGNSSDNCDQSLITPNTLYAAIALGIKSGSSLDMGSTRLYEFEAFGLSKSTTGAGEILIGTGYLRRF